MTLLAFTGYALLLGGPILAISWSTVLIEPIRVIILIASAFFWLISLLLSSTLWFVIVPMRDHLSFGIGYSVLFQEFFRYLLYWVLRRAEVNLEKVTTAQVADSRHVFAFVCGLGFGGMSGAFAFINVLADTIGPGTMGLRQGSEYFFLVSAVTTLCFVLLHAFWGVIFFAALDNKNRGQIVYIVGSHLYASYMTLLNGRGYPVASIVSVYLLLLVTASIAFKVVGGKIGNIPRCFSR